jgi:hypothetical protein
VERAVGRVVGLPRRGARRRSGAPSGAARTAGALMAMRLPAKMAAISAAVLLFTRKNLAEREQRGGQGWAADSAGGAAGEIGCAWSG